MRHSRLSVVRAVALIRFLICVETVSAQFFEASPLPSPINNEYGNFGPSITGDGLNLYFASTRPGGLGGVDLWIATRDTLFANWGEPQNLGEPLNTAEDDWGAGISNDGTELYFNRAPDIFGDVHGDIWGTRRGTVNDPWGMPSISQISSDDYATGQPSLTSDGLSLFFDSDKSPAGTYVSHRDTIADEFLTSELVLADAYWPNISQDGLSLAVTTPGFLTSLSTRPTTADEFSTLFALDDLGIAVDAIFVPGESDVLYFWSDRSGVPDGGGRFGDYGIWRIDLSPGASACDFDADGFCDLSDLDELQYVGLSSGGAKYDLDTSGMVDASDTIRWLDLIGSVPGDTDLDGDVDATDLNAVGSNWQSTNP